MIVGLPRLKIVETETGPLDSELVARTLAGEEPAFATIVERYQRKIFRVALAIVRDAAEADGITQDTFVQAFMNLSRFEGRSGLETWLTRIAINRSKDALRGRRWISLSQSDGDDDEPQVVLVDERPDAERKVLSHEIEGAVQRALTSLSAQQKTIFRLRHYEDMPLERIAEMLGLNSGTVRAHLFRAIQKVRKELSAFVAAAPEEAIR